MVLIVLFVRVQLVLDCQFASPMSVLCPLFLGIHYCPLPSWSRGSLVVWNTLSGAFSQTVLVESPNEAHGDTALTIYWLGPLR